jgi:hypothetical protein
MMLGEAAGLLHPAKKQRSTVSQRLLDELTILRNAIPAAHAPSLAGSEYKSKLEQVEVDNQTLLVTLRGRWSKWLIGWITALISFQIILTGLVGVKWFDFTGHQYFLPLVIGQNVVQVVGMGYVIVKFLYPSLARKG